MSFFIANEFRKVFDLNPIKVAKKDWDLPYINSLEK